MTCRTLTFDDPGARGDEVIPGASCETLARLLFFLLRRAFLFPEDRKAGMKMFLHCMGYVHSKVQELGHLQPTCLTEQFASSEVLFTSV